MLRGKLKYIAVLLICLTGTTYSQFYFFGRNKVHYEKFNWKILKTKHFDIYYYDGFEEIAEIGAKFAEDSYDVLKVKFNHVVTRRIPLIFYNTHIHFQQTNTLPGFIPEGVGGFFEFLKGRVVIPYLGSISKFKHVIRHELVHVYMSSKLSNVIRTHRVVSDRYPPLWFVEGLAEYWSYYWDAQAEMVMRDAVLNNLFVPIKQISKIYGSFLLYKEGQNFLQFVSETYGEDKILLLMENFWRFTKFTDVIEFTLGEPIERIDERWTYYLKKKYYPLYEKNYPYSIKTKKLTSEGFNFSPVYYKKDTTDFIYFIGNHTGYTSIYEMKYDSASSEIAEPEVVIEGEREKVFEAFHLLRPSIAVSSKGLLAFVNKSGPSDVINFYSLEKRELQLTKRFENLITISSPAFSSDGNSLVFSANDKKGFTDLFIYSLENKKLIRLTNDYYDDTGPVFGKGNETIVFASDRTDGEFARKYNLFEYDLKTHQIKYLTYSNSNSVNPVFSPDFKSLYFENDFDGTNNIWKLVTGKNGEPLGMKQCTKFFTSVFDFTFLNERKVILSSFENFSFQFYELNLNDLDTGSHQIKRFDFTKTGNKWLAGKIKVNPAKQKLKYERTYTLDYAVSQVAVDPVYGSRGGAVFALSDLLGDDKYYFLIYNTAEVQSEILDNFNVALSRINTSSRSNYGYGVFHFSGRRYDLRQSDEFFYERVFGGYFSMIYPFSSFDRLEVSTSLANSDRDLITELLARKALLLSNTISFVHDNSIWGPTGPLDGSRYRVLLGYTTDIKYNNANYYSVIADFRQYFRLSLRSTLAIRAAIFINQGKEAYRYIAGGSWDLRGWPRWSLRGKKLWITSIELRYPLIDRIYIKLPFLGINFSSLRGAVYFDAGNAWDDVYTETLGSLGVGVRFNLLGAVTFRYDVGKKIEHNFTKLQPGLFYQFFFGWDF